jgi:hypothetical protein
MPSNLYQMALTSLLDDERKALATLEGWLENVSSAPSGGSTRTLQGDRMVANLRAESHFLGDNSWGDSGEFATFLKRCAEEHARIATDPDRYNGYGDQCAANQGKGLRIRRTDLPSLLYRYVRSSVLVEVLVEKILGDSARADFQSGRLTIEDALSQVAEAWDTTALEDEDRLGAEWDKMIFATFEHPDGAPRDLALGMAEALALPVRPRRDEILIELTYTTDSVTNYRFPTIAEAGWAPEFQPAPEVEPSLGLPGSRWGWTRPLGAWPAQPELVHDNDSLRVLDGPPRFLGRYTL